MALFRCIFALTLLVGASAGAAKVTPIEKVIELIEGLKTEVEADGANEASEYDKFACFCKDETLEKSDSVKANTDKIKELSADIADKTQEKTNDITELDERKVKQETLKSDLTSTEVRCAKEKAEYEAEAADLSKAITDLKNAIKALKDSKPASFLALKGALVETIEMAEVLHKGSSSAKRKAVLNMLQQHSGVDPADPEYKFHSDDIIDVCEKLLEDYTASKTELDAEFAKTSKACADMIASLKEQISANAVAMDNLKKEIEKLTKEIAKDREDLVTTDGALKDDELYLTDLKARCEARAHDYDQRSSMRAAELSAITEALTLLTKDVEKRANEVNIRAALVQKAKAELEKANKPVLKTISKTLSLLQESSDNFLSRNGLTLSEARKNAAINLLNKEGTRLGSMALVALSAKASADPFMKVKGLIQKLIERLLEESKAEATKKGFCDTEVGKAEKDRDYRFSEAKDLNAELAKLEATRDELTAEIKDLKSDVKLETSALKEATADRKDEKEANMHTVKVSKEGYEACKEALLILKSFYKQAAKAAFIQASPVDEDTSGPGFKGAYKGEQSSSHAIIDLLETIISDFERTDRKTSEAEYSAQREFVDYEQTAKSSIAAKETKEELDSEDLATTLTTIKTKFSDLQNAMDLLDSALQELEELKPTCIDTGMSYAERVAKREEEMEALQNALCILDEEGVEPSCSGGLM
jgi:cell division protein FtsB